MKVPLLWVVALFGSASCVAIPPVPTRDPVRIAMRTKDLVEPNLAAACRRYAAGFTERRTMLACGKLMFFYETFGTGGVPSALPRMLLRAFPDEIGNGFEKLGMIEDPSSHEHLPFGMAQGKMIGLTTSIAYSCASCHVARLPDGRVAVGAPNHRYEYGHQILAMTVFPFIATGGPKGHDEKAVAVIQPMLDRLKANPRIWAKLGASLMSAMGSFEFPVMPAVVENQYATWPPGTQDFVIQPLPVDDKIEVVGKIPALFDLPRDEEIKKSGMVHAMYGWSGNASSLFTFMQGFIAVGGGDPKRWPEKKLRPLFEYLYSLTAPTNPRPPPRSMVVVGKQLFAQKGCTSCHDGPRHGGKRIYQLDEVGTDEQLARWLDIENKGVPCCDVKLADPLTRGVKSPRLNALWAQSRFLHNGSLSSLEELFCLRPRPTALGPPLSSGGHLQTCHDLTIAERQALIDYLRSL